MGKPCAAACKDVTPRPRLSRPSTLSTAAPVASSSNLSTYTALGQPQQARGSQARPSRGAQRHPTSSSVREHPPCSGTTVVRWNDRPTPQAHQRDRRRARHGGPLHPGERHERVQFVPFSVAVYLSCARRPGASVHPDEGIRSPFGLFAGARGLCENVGASCNGWAPCHVSGLSTPDPDGLCPCVAPPLRQAIVKTCLDELLVKVEERAVAAPPALADGHDVERKQRGRRSFCCAM